MRSFSDEVLDFWGDEDELDLADAQRRAPPARRRPPGRRRPPPPAATLVLTAPARGTTLFITHPTPPGPASRLHFPDMPLLTGANAVSVRVTGITPDPTASTDFHWTVRLDYVTRAQRPRTMVVAWSGVVRGGTLPANFLQARQGFVLSGAGGGARTTAVAGGNVTFIVSAVLNGSSSSTSRPGPRILAGDGPSAADIRSQCDSAGADATEASWLKNMACHESRNTQFVLSGSSPARFRFMNEPLMNSGGDGGAGIMQLTNPPPGPQELWDWTANVDAGARIFRQKQAIASAYPGLLRRQARNPRHPLGALFARTLRAARLGQLLIPDFTPTQVLEDGVRGYNGFAGNDGFGNRALHEFRLARRRDGLLAVTNIRVETIAGRPTRVADAVWERVPVAARPQGTGDPNYVENVRRAQCP